MADTKSKAQMLATYTESCFGHVGPMMDAAAELRRLDAVEAERDALAAQKDLLIEAMRDEMDEGLRLREMGGAAPDENITAMTERVIRERDALRAEVERLRVELSAAVEVERDQLRAADTSHREAFGAIFRALKPPDPNRDTWPAEIERMRADAERFRELCAAGSALCFDGVDCRDADHFGELIDARRKNRADLAHNAPRNDKGNR